MIKINERPILMSAPMVCATLDGRKSHTRRVVKSELVQRYSECIGTQIGLGYPASENQLYAGFKMDGMVSPIYVKCPYGKPGDYLWVRETWNYNNFTESGIPFIGYKADSSVLLREHPEDWAEAVENIWAHLSDDENYSIDQTARDRKFRPSIHMPRWASRILLEIVSVRVERLNNISEEDSRAEGIELVGGPASVSPWRNYRKGEPGEMDLHCSSAQRSFMTLWESINGAGSWAVNPWVWVVEFKKLD